ncbi:hypothetical protein PSTT_11764 [Puccinia striiformis]|uniref:DNA 3'-5' helicase n=2 Tax=Puccinia striiformis TaxID=27350 RepID=A0A2S4UYT7_9BASI|nr:hypothetical protein PSTT_11764 [Puccinia striiformis]
MATSEDDSDKDSDLQKLHNSQQENLKSKLVLPDEIQAMAREDLVKHISQTVAKYYTEPLKPIQMDSVINLVQRKHTFVLAGTGFGKSRIAEVYWHLFPAYKKPIILVLNPLDTLGDNQVAEKKKAKINAVNLTKMNMTPDIEKRVLRGDYGFVYLLILTVVDEAHMIFIWGLVASGLGKKITSHLKLQDRGVFRPSYGDLGARLLAAHGIPILLLSATCRPVAIDKILASLKITPENMWRVDGELTRPEIRLIRIPMELSLGSCKDLKRIFGQKSLIADNLVPPALIYSPTRNLTWQALKVINEARETRGGHHDPDSTFVRRFHSCTGDLDKLDIIEGFENHEFPVISCTMALGLGQNWKRVQSVVHMGRGDPASICQMIGRCGRGEDNPGLGIMFMETNRRNGKNKVEDFPNHEAFSNGYIQSEDDRMDALAITPVCLRIAFALDNKLGYVPLHNADRHVVNEKTREAEKGFAECLCSNCDPSSAEELIAALKHLHVGNFKENITSRKLNFEVPISPPLPKVTRPRSCITKKTGKKKLEGELENFAVFMVQQFDKFHRSHISPEYSEFKPSAHFGLFKARRMVLAFHKGFTAEQLDRLIGGDAINGQMPFLQAKLEDYIKTEQWKNYLVKLREEEQLANETKRKGITAKRQAALKRTAEDSFNTNQNEEETKQTKVGGPGRPRGSSTSRGHGRGRGRGRGCVGTSS